MREFWRQVFERLTALVIHLTDNHPGKVFGTMLGFFLGIIIVLLGFWRTIVIMLFVLVGFYFGKRHDEQKDFGQLLQSLFGNRK